MIIKRDKVEARISSRSYDYGEYYLGTVRIYEKHDKPSNDSVYRRWLYTARTTIKRLTAEDAQQDAIQLAHDILSSNNIPYLTP